MKTLMHLKFCNFDAPNFRVELWEETEGYFVFYRRLVVEFVRWKFESFDQLSEVFY